MFDIRIHGHSGQKAISGVGPLSVAKPGPGNDVDLLVLVQQIDGADKLGSGNRRGVDCGYCVCRDMPAGEWRCGAISVVPEDV